MKYLYNPPWLIKKIFYDFYWETANNKILISFDDGPNHETSELILKKLSDEKIKALFFIVGDNAVKYPELTKEIVSEGHTFGNHTLNHKKISLLSESEIDFQISSVQNIFIDKFNVSLKYFRPPYGRFNFATSSFMKKYNLKNVMWSLLTFDYKNDLSIVKFAVKKYLKNNSLIVLHDSLKSKNIILDSISLIAEEARNRNYEFGVAEECLS
jgi:peptidoglycan/xylan/chitin deacetylase (PgdA/CDA1 family)